MSRLSDDISHYFTKQGIDLDTKTSEEVGDLLREHWSAITETIGMQAHASLHGGIIGVALAMELLIEASYADRMHDMWMRCRRSSNAAAETRGQLYEEGK